MYFISTFFSGLQAIDLKLMVLINRRLANPVFDMVMPWLRESILWMPFYLYLLVWASTRLGKAAIWWISSMLLTVTLSDQLSSSFIKNAVARVRPCRDPEVLPYILLRIENCSGAYSFTSSHAANHFAVAVFVFGTLHPLIGKKNARLMFLWAAAIGYAQIYVGVHYPFDVLGGIFVGLLSGWATTTLYYKIVGRI